MEPVSIGNDVIRCTLCENAVAPMFWENCQIYLCGQCDEKHLFDKSKVHKVLPLQPCLSNLRYPMCTIHTEQCKLHCDECDISVCVKCMSSKDHKNHDVVDIMEYYDKIEEIVKKDLQELESSIYLKYQEIESSIIKQKNDLKKISQSLTTSLKAQGELWHREIDIVIHKMQSEVEEIDSKNLSLITKQEDYIQHKLTEMSHVILGLKKLLDSIDDSGVSQYKSRNAEFRELPPSPEIILPNFQPRDINIEQLMKQFGTLSKVVIRDQEISVPR